MPVPKLPWWKALWVRSKHIWHNPLYQFGAKSAAEGEITFLKGRLDNQRAMASKIPDRAALAQTLTQSQQRMLYNFKTPNKVAAPEKGSKYFSFREKDKMIRAHYASSEQAPNFQTIERVFPKKGTRTANLQTVERVPKLKERETREEMFSRFLKQARAATGLAKRKALQAQRKMLVEQERAESLRVRAKKLAERRGKKSEIVRLEKEAARLERVGSESYLFWVDEHTRRLAKTRRLNAVLAKRYQKKAKLPRKKAA